MQIKKKIERSGNELGKLNSALRHAEQDEDQEIITQEERECFRKIGLKMDSILVLGKQEFCSLQIFPFCMFFSSSPGIKNIKKSKDLDMTESKKVLLVMLSLLNLYLHR